MQTEGEKVDFTGNSPIQTTMVVDQLIQDPGAGAATDHHHDMMTMACPTIPKRFKSSHKAGFWRIQPLNLI
ncbi:MAG: hypothetical protein IJ708_13165 [Clostridia bacterium]|nr:hypothetical protein [Clostridia bacterium]